MTDYVYAWRNGWRWALESLRLGGVGAALRQLWHAYVRGYISECCQLCGRTYLVWWADNDLYERVTGYATPKGDNAGGGFCLTCFDRLAQRQGLVLQWQPIVIEKNS